MVGKYGPKRQGTTGYASAYTFCSIMDKLLELAVLILLSSLSKDYDNFVIPMGTRDKLPTLERLKTNLLEKGKHRASELGPFRNERQTYLKWGSGGFLTENEGSATTVARVVLTRGNAKSRTRKKRRSSITLSLSRFWVPGMKENLISKRSN